NDPLPLPNNTETVLSPSFVSAKSSFPSPLKSPTTTPLGECPTLKSVRGKVPAKLPVNAAEESCDTGETRLAESNASVIGKCSPTKKVAGRPSSTRSNTRCARLTRLRVREKFADA